MTRHAALCLVVLLVLGCASHERKGTLAELERVEADVSEITLDDSLDLAAQSYRRFLAETAVGERTPEAMRRLADLQLEREYGVHVDGSPQERAAPAAGAATMTPPEAAGRPVAESSSPHPALTPAETLADFERRTTAPAHLPSAHDTYEVALPGADSAVPEGPREAIATYWRILQTYPGFERNDQVLYQLSRAYDEIGQPDEAVAVMNKLVAEHPDSKYVDEVHFRRGEYYFVRKKYGEAEDAYEAIIAIGDTSSFYELALYKQGWSLYKRDFYEEALHRYVAMLDHRLALGYEFDRPQDDKADARIADTFRVISLSFSNLGGPEVLDEYFSEHGTRLYSDKIYSNLGEFYFGKRRYEDAASVYKSFVALRPFHKVAPHFSMRVVDIYREAGFSQPVVEAKTAFATEYALDAAYWQHHEIAAMPEVVGYLKTNLNDLAGHYHALYQDEELTDEQEDNFRAAQRWYRQYLASFPEGEDTPRINYQLADLLLENGDYGAAATEYERTAYDYAQHDKQSAAGYAAIYAHRQGLDAAADEQRPSLIQATVGSSLRFADTFPQHEQAPPVLGAAADMLYEIADHARAIEVAQKLVGAYPQAEAGLRRAAWAVVAHSSIDLALFAQAESAYRSVLGLTADDDENRAAVVDGLAAAIYKQGEAASAAGDYRAAADHFLRVRHDAPDSKIRSAAEYDAAAALMQLEDWTAASGVLEEFRTNHPDHELNAEATRHLAHVYRESGELHKSAVEHERIAEETDDLQLRQAARLTAAELYDEAQMTSDAVRVYEQYVAAYPRPLDIAVQTRSRLAEIYAAQDDQASHHEQLRAIVAADRDAGAERTDRSRFLAARAALVLAEKQFQHFADLSISAPLEHSLVEKQARMDNTMATLEALVDYQVPEVTAAATFYIAETFRNFGAALLDSARPADLSGGDLADYEMALEEEAYPFEERAIEVHEANFELLVGGVHNRWVQRSLAELTVLMPGRYSRPELSTGPIGTVDAYAYVAPEQPGVAPDSAPPVEAAVEADDDTTAARPQRPRAAATE